MTTSTSITIENVAIVAGLIRLTDALDRATDDKDWARARRLFADQVDADFSSLSGVPAGNVAADGMKLFVTHQRGNEWVRDTIPPDSPRD
jgi:hypothetical protein